MTDLATIQEALAPGPSSWFVVRPAVDADISVIRESWSGTWKRARGAGCVPNDMIDGVTQACISGLIARGMRITVLAPVDRPEQILAWVAHEPDLRQAAGVVVHYLFTKEPFRRRGLAQTLLDKIGAGKSFTYTHQTGFAKYWPKAFHNPGIARRKAL